MTSSIQRSELFRTYVGTDGGIWTLPRLATGTVVIGVTWLVFTLLVMFSAFFLNARLGETTLTFTDGSALDHVMAGPIGFFAALLTFAGIWIGAWLAMRLMHREPVGRLLGSGGRICLSQFWKGFAAILLTSLTAELAILAIWPGLAPGRIGPGAWLLAILPVMAAAFVQTSSEELLFRGYLLRGLARRFRSPLAWGVLPALVFTALHWNMAAPLALNLAVMASIGAFAGMLVLLVHATGNLGAAMGAHLANNLTGFLLVSHDQALDFFALFKGAPLQALTSTLAGALLLVAISLVSVLLSLVLLLYPRSPLALARGKRGPA